MDRDYEDIVRIKLKKLRELNELKQNDLAIVIKKSRECYNQYETGKRKININDLCKIADEYDIPLDWFTGRSVETNKRIKEKSH